MNKFVFYTLLTVICGILTGAFSLLEYNGAVGIFTSLLACLAILGVSWGVYPNPSNIRKRNALRIILFLGAFHICLLFSLGGSPLAVKSFDTNNLDTIVSTMSKTYLSFKGLGEFFISMVKVGTPAKTSGIKFGYLLFGICLLTSLYKFVKAWGLGCILCCIGAVSIIVLLINFWDPQYKVWNFIGLGTAIALCILTYFYGKKSLLV